MLNKAKINAIHELLEKDIISTEEYMLILNALGSKEVKSDEIGDDNRISIDIIVDAVCNYFNLKAEDLMSNERSTELVLGRHYIAYLARNLTGATYKEIAEVLGKRDYSSIMYGERCICDELEKNDEARHKLKDIENIIYTTSNAA